MASTDAYKLMQQLCHSLLRLSCVMMAGKEDEKNEKVRIFCYL
jgi:hypothetical protein